MNLNNITHIGVLCKDMDKAMEEYQNKLGIGPWEDFGELHENAVMKGTNHKLNYRASMAPFGKIQMELIQPLDGDIGIFQDAMKENGEAIHHVCIGVENIDEAKKQALAEGYEILDEVPMYEMQPGFSLGFFYIKPKNASIVYELVEERHA